MTKTSEPKQSAKQGAKQAATKRPTAKAGRPPGAKTRQREQVAVIPSRCPVCGSTERLRYTRTTETAYGGTDPAGNPYTHLVRRWTACRDCGQSRIDKTFESRPAKKK